jgi:anti-sigma factor RsiW
MDCTDARELLDGYLDDELDAAHAAQVARHLNSCEACRAAHAAAVRLRAAVRDHAPRYRAPAQLRASIVAATGGKTAAAREHRWLRPGEWLRLGASFAFAVVLAWSVTYHFVKPSAADLLTDQVLSAHVRGVLSGRPIDVASSDRHTVKPWLSARLDFSPPVADFAQQGFALSGGRLDYLDGRPIAVLVYQYRNHVISAFVWPDAGADEAGTERESVKGYHVARWSAGGFRHYVVSDLEEEQLARFVVLLRAAEPAGKR